MESEIRASYPEQSTAHYNNVANITIGSDSTTPQKKKNGREEDCQEDRQEYRKIPSNKNGESKSMITIKKIEPK